MAEMAVEGLLEFWPCKSVNNPNFGLPTYRETITSNVMGDIPFRTGCINLKDLSLDFQF